MTADRPPEQCARDVMEAFEGLSPHDIAEAAIQNGASEDEAWTVAARVEDIYMDVDSAMADVQRVCDPERTGGNGR